MGTAGRRLRAKLLPSLPARAIVALAAGSLRGGRVVRRRVGHARVRGGAGSALDRTSRWRCWNETGLARRSPGGGDRQRGRGCAAGAQTGGRRRARRSRLVARPRTAFRSLPGVAPDLAGAVREALRSLELPHALAQSPLASGQGIAQRAASVRALILEAEEQAFGETADERLLNRVLVRGYLDPASSHEQAAAELHLSRSTYFRRLKAASDRVAEYVATQLELMIAPEWRGGTAITDGSAVTSSSAIRAGRSPCSTDPA